MQSDYTAWLEYSLWNSIVGKFNKLRSSSGNFTFFQTTRGTFYVCLSEINLLYWFLVYSLSSALLKWFSYSNRATKLQMKHYKALLARYVTYAGRNHALMCMSWFEKRNDAEFPGSLRITELVLCFSSNSGAQWTWGVWDTSRSMQWIYERLKCRETDIASKEAMSIYIVLVCWVRLHKAIQRSCPSHAMF